MEQQPFNNCGPLISAKAIAEKYFDNSRTPRWVLSNVCPDKRIEYSSATIRWLEANVVEWLQNPPGPSAKPRR